ncbi:hypothetical protein V8C34DRAFT_83165 [Trichoderma compactum]
MSLVAELCFNLVAAVFWAIGDVFAQDGGDGGQWKREQRIRDQEEPFSSLTIALLDESLFERAFCLFYWFGGDFVIVSFFLVQPRRGEDGQVDRGESQVVCGLLP